MSLLAKCDIRGAIQSLRRNKARSIVTMLGVVIGVAAVTIAVGIGDGIKAQVDAQTKRLGSDLITIRPGQLLSSGPAQLHAGPFAGVTLGGALTPNDISVTQKTPGVAKAVPLSVVNTDVVNGDTTPASALVIGTDSGLPGMVRQQLAYGVFFGDGDTSADKVVLGSQAADRLFSESVPLGQTLTILGHPFVVVGIMHEFQTAPLSLDVNFNDAVFIPYASARQITNNNSPLYEILARPANMQQTDAVADKLRGALIVAHGGQTDFTVLKQTQTIAVAGNILTMLTALISGIAAIALIVGGVGIMNVMLVSVTERMHEIGIRKAIGATSRQILGQFITEAAVLSMAGGLIGIVLAGLVETAVALLTDLKPAVAWQAAAIAFLVSVGVGIIFGSIPAAKAARKQPIEALRSE